MQSYSTLKNIYLYLAMKSEERKDFNLHNIFFVTKICSTIN